MTFLRANQIYSDKNFLLWTQKRQKANLCKYYKQLAKHSTFSQLDIWSIYTGIIYIFLFNIICGLVPGSQMGHWVCTN